MAGLPLFRRHSLFLKIVFILWAFFSFFQTAVNAEFKPDGAAPDQVLVLYNADYDVDTDGSLTGQDSKEVAEYYARMHADPVSGKRPYLLGLKCRHGKKHLNNWFIQEDSNDNKTGVVFKGMGRKPGHADCVRDSRKVEINLVPGKTEIDWETVEFYVQDRNKNRKKVTHFMVSGIPVRKSRRTIYPEIGKSKGRCFRFDAHKLFSGTVDVFVTAKNQSGRIIKNSRFTFWDIEDFQPSIYGEDGILDEKNFQEDVAIPVKTFLESSKNSLPDGKFLKDHIRYIVVAHGLPFSCKSVFGIERGVTSKSNDHGALGSLEQRLQTLYYGWGKQIIPPVVSRFMSGGPDSDAGVRNYKIISVLTYPLTGRRWNPYMHPDTYSFLGRKKTPGFIYLPLFEEERIKTPSYFFGYGVSRIDGQGPREAKRIIDYSLYASKYLRPEMIAQKAKTDLKPSLKEIEKRNLWGREEIRFLNFSIISKHSKEGLPFLKRPVKQKDFVSNKNVDPVYQGYFPGGMERTVVSSNGWNIGRSAPIWRQIDQGVTVSACGGPAYGEGPHITNATFWDNRILIRYLFRGRDLGECFLRSTYYVNWATSLVGDPLYHPDLSKTVIDRLSPAIGSKDDISIQIGPTMDRYSGVFSVVVRTSKKNPEVCLLKVYYQKQGTHSQQESSWPIYSSKPYAILRNLEPDAVYSCRPILTDPYNNITDLTETFGPITFKTGPPIVIKNITKQARKRKKNWEIDTMGIPGVSKSATLIINFIAGQQGLIPGVESKGIQLKAVKYPDKKHIRISYSFGGPQMKEMILSPLKKGETATLILRWRRFPLTREIVLKAKDNTEFTIAADVRTPWVKINPDLRLKFNQRNGVKIISGSIVSNALPASKTAFGLAVNPIDVSLWEASNK